MSICASSASPVSDNFLHVVSAPQAPSKSEGDFSFSTQLAQLLECLRGDVIPTFKRESHVSSTPADFLPLPLGVTVLNCHKRLCLWTRLDNMLYKLVLVLSLDNLPVSPIITLLFPLFQSLMTPGGNIWF